MGALKELTESIKSKMGKNAEPDEPMEGEWDFMGAGSEDDGPIAGVGVPLEKTPEEGADDGCA